MEVDSDAICGLWIDKDDTIVKEISQYIQTHLNKHVERADLKNFLRNDIKYERYVIFATRTSLKNHELLLVTTQVLYQLYYLGLIANVLIVNIDKNIRENSIPINLKVFDIIKVQPDTSSAKEAPKFKEKELQELVAKLSEKPRPIAEIIPKGKNIGIGLAWSYFYGYLNLILPELASRIEKSTWYKSNPGKMSKKFFIIIPESCNMPSRFADVDPRFITEGPLDEGIKKSRAGQPDRLYKNFVHKIQQNEAEKERYFCGEFATAILALRKMVEEGIIDETELTKQRVLFHYTLTAILKNKWNKLCSDQAIIICYPDQKKSFFLADELISTIENEGKKKEALNKDTVAEWSLSSSSVKASSSSSWVHIDVLDIISGEGGSRWQQGVLDLYGIGTEITIQINAVTFSEILHHNMPPAEKDPKKKQEETPRDKLLIILTEDFKEKVEEYAQEIINHEIISPRTTFIVDLDSIPDWLERSGVDYMDARKTDIWKRIFGSIYGTFSVEGNEDERLKKLCSDKHIQVGQLNAGPSEGEVDGNVLDLRKQYQVERLPIGFIAEGLAWSYLLNYLSLIGPTMRQRIEKTEHCKNSLMPSKLFILLPSTCFCHPALTAADERITKVDNLETLSIQIAGNKRPYDTAVYKIPAKGKSQPSCYYACVEYCTPVLVMYEMEAEGHAGLTPKQKENQLKIFYKTLQKILSQTDYAQNIELIQYNDHVDADKNLSEILLENIKKNL
jgi:hypothetical protein